MERPYKAFGYPLMPTLYILAASTISIVLLLYKTKTSLPGRLIVLTGVPVYFSGKSAQKPSHHDLEKCNKPVLNPSARSS